MINSLEELKELSKEKKDLKRNSHEELRVCIGSSCSSLNSENILKDLKKQVKENNLDEKCKVKGVGCNGLCSEAIMVAHYHKVGNKESLYSKIEPSNIQDLIDTLNTKTPIQYKKCDKSQSFFTRQKKIVLENAGIIDPDDIDDYIAYNGYLAFYTALDKMTPQEVINEIKISKLRGRGGGGYLTGLKWESVSKVDAEKKYIVCNGDEGDPGAFMDRAIMEADPHKLIEGMALAGYACNAQHGYIYVRAEYPIAVQKLNKAIKQARRKGILGNQISQSGFCFDIDIRLGGGAFVCGEATALIASIEGNRGNPRQKPPHLSDYGLWKSPTVLNNVETYANIASIIRHGGEWFRKIGTENSTGTKVFALTGHIKNTGLVEVPMGITLRELIYEVGGGLPKGKKFKAIQTGGPSGGCIPENLLDTPVDYDSLKEIGSIMGSGGLIVMDESSKMIEVARFFMDFSKSESCGKCVPCRVGTTQLTSLLDKFIKKEATKSDYDLLKNTCNVLQESSLCGLGQTAPNPVLSTIKYFENEYLEGICND